MVGKISQNITDLENHLSEQIYFLESSAKSFDAGYEGEAKRLATSLRVLLHDTNSSKSLLGQLNLKSLQFLDTAFEYDPRNLLTFSGLTIQQISLSEAKYVPLLEETFGKKIKKIDFEKWWNAIIFKDNKNNKMSRKDIILAIANQDGGAHVDPNLNEIYANLSRQNSLNWFFISENNNTFQPFGGPHLASIRQIAYEVLITLKDRPKKKKDRSRPRKI